MDRAVLIQKNARRLVLMFRDRLPAEYEQANRVLQQYTQSQVSAQETAARLHELLTSNAEAAQLFGSMIGSLAPPSEPDKTFQVKQAVERIFPLLKEKMPHALELLTRNQGILKWNQTSCRNEQELVDVMLTSLRQLGFPDVEAAERIITGAPKPSRSKSPTHVPAPSPAPEPEPEPAPLPSPEPLSAFDHQLADLSARLTPAELDMLARLFQLYWRNVISFPEFRDLAEGLGAKLGKDTSALLKAAIDAREGQRLTHNSFNIKLSTHEVEGRYNRSYRKIESQVPFTADPASLINKAYLGIAIGTENNSGAATEEAQSHEKSLNEKRLIETEDRMFEIDSTLAQLRFAAAALANVAAGKGSAEVRAASLVKVANTGILSVLFDTKALELFRAKLTDPKMAEFVEARVRERIEELERHRTGLFEPTWRSTLTENYYKAMDVRSHRVKHFMTAAVNQKVILQELRGTPTTDRMRIISSLEVALSLPARDLTVPLELRSLHFWSPLLAFEVTADEPLADAVFFLKAFAWLKGAANEKERALQIVERLADQFLGVAATKSSVAELATADSLYTEAVALEPLLHPDRPFLYGPRARIEQNNQKVADLESRLREVGRPRPRRADPPPPSSVNDQFDAVLQSNSADATLFEAAIARRSIRPDVRFFFGQQNFHQFFRYILMLYDRFTFASAFSTRLLGGNRAYLLFKRALLFFLFDVIDVQAYEDLIRIIFDASAGAFFSAEKIFTSILKTPTDDFTNFVFALNADMFEGKIDGLEAEEVLFAKTCHRQSELSALAHRPSRAAVGSVPLLAQSDPAELFKFEFYSSLQVLIVHKLKSAFAGSVNTMTKFLKKHSQVLAFCREPDARPRKTRCQRGALSRKIVHYAIRRMLVPRVQKTASITSGTEDVVLSLGARPELDRRREQRRRFAQTFRDKLAKITAAFEKRRPNPV